MTDELVEVSGKSGPHVVVEWPQSAGLSLEGTRAVQFQRTLSGECNAITNR